MEINKKISNIINNKEKLVGTDKKGANFIKDKFFSGSSGDSMSTQNNDNIFSIFLLKSYYFKKIVFNLLWIILPFKRALKEWWSI